MAIYVTLRPYDGLGISSRPVHAHGNLGCADFVRMRTDNIKFLAAAYRAHARRITLCIEKSLNCLKNGKACGPDGLTKENVLYPSVVIHLKMLFNIISGHGFVPDNFGLSVTIPVVKDKT